MKLEPKYLAPYLPYGLKVKILNYKCDYVGIEYSEANGFYSIGDEFFVTYNGGSTGKSISDFKPLLRPLSDLKNKVIIHNGEEVNLWKKYDLVLHEDEVCDEYYAEYAETPKAYVPVYWMSWWLFEYHFDVFGLIDAGLAINLNTINPQTCRTN